MTFEQLHFAFGASIPFIISLFFYDKKFIFYTPLIMTITGFIAFLPHFFGWTGAWTNFFFLYDIIENIFSRGQFYGYILIVAMFTVVVGLQAFYLWRNKHA
ncbi:hypothetical protein KY332_05225 [Candidatus Woesearchaeota archaeon]|nr:hypothetical protein [Candidatus Woesearchaeota archaeon]